MDRLIPLQALIETHDQPFVVVDKGLKVVAVNDAFERRFGADRTDVLGKLCYQVFQCQGTPCSEDVQVCPHKQILQTLQPFAGVFDYCNGAGRSYQVRIKGFPLTDSNGEVYIGEVLTPLVEQQGDAPTAKMVGNSKRFHQLVAQLERAAGANIPVLLEGETGTGKELAAAFIHGHSWRKEKPMVTVDCTVLGEDLFESELFGHERGAFTGSAGAKKGLFELADGGTLFLDEIGEMPLAMQVKLLRALESGTFRRVGGTRTLTSDVRLICATNRSLAELVKQGGFRQDLYYRIAVLIVRLPPLREHREDIPAIAASLLERMVVMAGKRYELSREALVRLMGHDYPGNIRELRNILQLAATMSLSEVIEPEDIQLEEAETGGGWQDGPQPDVTTDQADTTRPEVTPLQAMESQYISELLRRYQGRRGAVASAMGVSERTLYRKLKRFGIN